MTIQEAIRSGKRFKRPEGTVWWSAHTTAPFTSTHTLILNSCDLFATDWEVEEERIEITQQDLALAVAKFGWNLNTVWDALKELKK